MPLSDFACRITHAYSQAAPIIHSWALKCDKIVVYQHIEEDKKDHIHILLEGCQIDKKQLRNLAAKALSPGAVKGNENMSFRSEPTDDKDKYITYMTKGKYQPSYNKGYTPEYLEKCRLAWVEPTQYVKKTYHMKLWEEYEKVAPKSITPTKEQEEAWLASADIMPPWAITFTQVRNHVYSWLMKRYHGIDEPKLRSDRTTLIRTYCYRNHISIPEKYDNKL